MDDGGIQRAMTARLDQVRSDLLKAVDDAVARLAVETLMLPHVVWVLDHRTGGRCCFGPFVSPVDACVHAEFLVQQIVGEGTDASGLEVEVVPLEAAVAWGAADSTGPAARRSVASVWWRRVGGVLPLRRRRIDQERAQHS